MRRVVVESPCAGVNAEIIERNARYLRACLADCLRRDEAPFASHGLYTQSGVLNDADPTQRALGIRAGFAWREAADLTVVYVDLGTSRGMRAGIDHATKVGCHVEYRRLSGAWCSDDVVPEVMP